MTTKSLLLAGTIFLALWTAATGDEPAKSEPAYTTWIWPVTGPKGRPKEELQLLETLRTVVGSKLKLQDEPEKSIGCCLWVEVADGVSEINDEGYVILLQRGGGWLKATSTKQLEAAIERLRKVSQVRDGTVHLPLGVLTNHRVIAPKE